jgi:nitrite reductase/ring-hydroxylating ferredoxin subunit
VVGQWSAGRLVGVAAINAPQDFNLLRRILDAGQSMTPEAFASSTELRSRPNHTPEGSAEPVPVAVTPSDAPHAPATSAPSTPPPPPPSPAQGTAPNLAACPLEDIEEGAIGSTSLPDGTRIDIYRIQGDEVFATDDKCSHGSSSLCDEGSLEGHLIECGLHLGSFDVRTGKPVSAPCTKAIRSYPAQVRNGTIWIATQPIEPSP